MGLLRLSLALLAGPLLQAAGVEPRAKPEQYPVHAKLDQVAIGAEYTVRSFGTRGKTFVTRDYLVVEVAVYPAGGRPLLVSHGQFTLRVNGRKSVLFPQAPSFVAASLKYPDWERRPTLTAGAGLGDVGVVVGKPETVGRFPGDPRPDQTRLPNPPRAPRPEDPGGAGRQPAESAEEIAVETALPEGETKHPVGGYLYFAYKSKTKSIRSLELIYRGAAGEAVLQLM